MHEHIDLREELEHFYWNKEIVIHDYQIEQGITLQRHSTKGLETWTRGLAQRSGKNQH